MTFFRTHWRGEAGFWRSLLIGTLLIPIAVTAFIIWQVGVRAVLDPPYTRIVQNILGFSVIGLLAIWQLVGNWRATKKSQTPSRWWMTRWVSRLVSLAVTAAAAIMLSTMPNGMTKLYQSATDADTYGLQGYDVSVEDDRLYVKGAFAWGLLDKVAGALKENTQVQTIVLASPGGHVGVGTHLAALIKSRGLNTEAADLCASSCTIAFMGGVQRSLSEGARLGFHAVSGEGADTTAAGQQRLLEYFHNAGVSEDFVAHVARTPANDLWFPAREELLEANVITPQAQ